MSIQSWSVIRRVRSYLWDTQKLSIKKQGLVICPVRHKHLPPKLVSQMFIKFGKMPEVSPFSSKSHELFLFRSVLYPCHPGGFHLLPLGQRVLDKLIKIIDQEMEMIGAQKLSLTTLAPKAVWSQSGRWESTGAELFKLKDRDKKEYCLGPTHEELVTDMVRDLYLLKAAYPLKLYQITRKFRDEAHPRFGLLRGREFEMKDLYTFDRTLENARNTYDIVCNAYTEIFKRLDLKVIKAEAAVGNIGGSLSHEFHLESEVGEDRVYKCLQCGHVANAEVTGMNDEKKPFCSKCGSNKLQQLSCIEVGHSFLLGTKYSEVFKAAYNQEGVGKSWLEMGCYGLGVTRLLQAMVEVNCLETRLKWPKVVAPYQVCVIPQKEGFMSYDLFNDAHRLATELNNMDKLKGEVFMDDRIKRSIGQRLWDMKNLGIPYVVIVSSLDEGRMTGMYELQDVYKDQVYMLSECELIETLNLFAKTV
ncbi:hypothetical protein FSP39_011319 [Pinctada imbricata]|uniref:Probable proline--tRNA ligase, mitochondrial n=1 Tax=Pinctada imbricata TaxID=66713 RepID=A0AA88XQH4_PINIB|nr:hypothetical protein FSP39_011319 [Pinctada imbricata]